MIESWWADLYVQLNKQTENTGGATEEILSSWGGAAGCLSSLSAHVLFKCWSVQKCRVWLIGANVKPHNRWPLLQKNKKTCLRTKKHLPHLTSRWCYHTSFKNPVTTLRSHFTNCFIRDGAAFSSSCQLTWSWPKVICLHMPACLSAVVQLIWGWTTQFISRPERSHYSVTHSISMNLFCQTKHTCVSTQHTNLYKWRVECGYDWEQQRAADISSAACSSYIMVTYILVLMSPPMTASPCRWPSARVYKLLLAPVEIWKGSSALCLQIRDKQKVWTSGLLHARDMKCSADSHTAAEFTAHDQQNKQKVTVWKTMQDY